MIRWVSQRRGGMNRFLALVIIVALGAVPCIAEPGAPIVAYLELRDHWVAVHADAGAQTYTVRTSAGLLIGEELTLAQLSDLVPDVAESLRTALAGGEAGFVWAGNNTAP